MVKKIIVTFIAILSFTGIFAGIGDWSLYPSYHNAKHCEVAGDKVYVLASGALYSYNKKDNELMTYDKTFLNDIEITNIAYSKSQKALVIVYKNANIDILYDDESIYNIPDFMNKLMPNKTINNLEVQGNNAYISTEFGIIVLNLEKLEFTNTYYLDTNTYCCYLFKDKMYTGTDKGLYSCDTTQNLLDKNNWEQVNNSIIYKIAELDNKLYLLENHDKVKSLDSDGNIKDIVNSDKIQTIYSYKDKIITTREKRLYIISSDGKIKSYKIENSSNYMALDENTVWICSSENGLVEYKIEENVLKESKEGITPNSPVRNYFEFTKITNNDKLLIAGGNLNYLDLTFYEGTIMEYDYNNDKWFNFPSKNIKDLTGYRYVNICTVDEDPNEPGHYFAGSFGYGIYEFRNGEFVAHYNNETTNDTISSVVPSSSAYVRVPVVRFDKESNLWCINTGVKDILKVKKNTGEWLILNYKDVEHAETVSDYIIDSRGWLWMVLMQNDAGLFCAKTKNTLFDTSDDETQIWKNHVTNQDGISYDVYQIYAFKEDKNGHLWVGTNTGLFVIDNPEQFFKDGIFKQVKVPRNDGSGLADYLMNGLCIKVIAVDDANRKWIGTDDSGIYLLSEDGLETIHHFTTENSLLPSNNITSITVNNSNGEVFIGTNKGLASFTSDAVTPAEKLEKENIHVYPNPVRADYSGSISIVGITGDCNVKITDTGGYLINEGVSNGGMYNWNGRNMRGEKVSSGIYYVLMYDQYGNESIATKILITK